jgi:hypothetical protein
MTDSHEKIGFMYMLAEPSLVEYAERLNEDVPGAYNYIKPEGELDSINVDITTPNINAEPSSRSPSCSDSNLEGAEFFGGDVRGADLVVPIPDIQMNSFKTKIISFYVPSL